MGDLTEHFSLREFRSPDGADFYHPFGQTKSDAFADRAPQWWDDFFSIPEYQLRVLCYRTLEPLRYSLASSGIHVVSGYRSIAYNRRNPGRAKYSAHLLGCAADIRVRIPKSPKFKPRRLVTRSGNYRPDVVAWRLYDMMRNGDIPKGGIGVYPTYVHVDCRGVLKRWDHRAGRCWWREARPDWGVG